MSETIRAAVCREFDKPLTIETVTLADPGPGEVKVAVKACAICHSDIIYAEGGWGGDAADGARPRGGGRCRTGR